MTKMTEQGVAGQLSRNKPTVTVRPIQPDDAGLIHAMHERLSAESLYYRYLRYRKPTLDEIEQVCRLDPDKGAGLVATIQADPESIVGVAYYVREPQEPEPTAEPGILVEDQFQGQGIGRRLWRQMQECAQLDQIRWLHVLFHPNNERVFRLLRSGGFPYQAKARGGVSEYLVALGEQN